MKPTKNRIFCMACKRAKMVFESKKKALNFIRFNAATIAEESGEKPIRAYFCTSCAGWHLTSKPLPGSPTQFIRNYLRLVRQAEISNDILHARRFLCYAERYALNIGDDKTQLSMLQEIKKQTAGLINTQRLLQIKNGNSHPELQEIELACKPMLIHKHDGKYYYSLCRGKLNVEEMQKTIAANQLTDSETICNITSHRLAVVDIEYGHSIHRKQYDSITEIFPQIVESHFLGNYLYVAEIAQKKNKEPYSNVSHYDYWIRAGERNVHFFRGSRQKFICICTEDPIDENRSFTFFKRVEMTNT